MGRSVAGMSSTEAPRLTIGALSRESGVKVPTIRFYEEIRLLPEPPRTSGNQRSYGREDVERLRFIRHARELGFDIEVIRELLGLADAPDRPCVEVDAIAAAHLVGIEARLRRLRALQAELRRMLEEGSHGRIAECRVIEVLAGEHPLLNEAPTRRRRR